MRLAASDVANFLACKHLARLDMLHARGLVEVPHDYDALFQDLVKRGGQHEKAVLPTFIDEACRLPALPPINGTWPTVQPPTPGQSRPGPM